MYTKRYLVVLAAALLFSLPAYADKNPPNPCGNHGNNCNPNDPPNDPPGNGGTKIDIDNTNTNTNTNRNTNLSWNSNRNTNTAMASGGAGGQGGQGGTGVGGNATGGNATGGTATSSATGGSANATGGTSSSNSGGNSLSLTTNEAAQPDDITIRQAPDIYVAAPYATASCYKTGSGGVSGILGGLSISAGKIDVKCEFRELVRIAATIDTAAAKRLLCLDEAFQLANAAQCTGLPVVYRVQGRR